MKTIYKFLVITLLVSGLMFARNGKNNLKVEVKKVSSDYYWVKDQSDNNGDNKLERKRSHKRRRKMRKPIKGLR